MRSDSLSEVCCFVVRRHDVLRQSMLRVRCSAGSDTAPVAAAPVVVSAEFVSFVLALLIYSVRYAAVYWYTSATYSALLAAALLGTALHTVYAHCAMQVLYKLSVSIAPHRLKTVCQYGLVWFHS